jgi:hypothetical protein
MIRVTFILFNKIIAIIICALASQNHWFTCYLDTISLISNPTHKRPRTHHQGKVTMSNKAIAGDSPMSFKAGGKSASNAASSLNKRERLTEEKKDDLNLFDQIAPPPPSACHRPSLQPSPLAPPPSSSSSKYVPAHLSVVRAGLYQKRSPLEIKNWIACLLTLDGRDKFTKVSIDVTISSNEYSQCRDITQSNM